MKLLEIYRSFLNSFGIVDRDSLLYYAEDNRPVEFTYNKVKRHLALPTTEMIKNGMVDNTGAEAHPFHPLCEDVLRGESGTIRYLKREIKKTYLKYSLMMVGEIIRIRSGKTQPRSTVFSKFISTHLSEIKEIPWDASLMADYEAATNEVLAMVDDACSIYISNKVKIDGESYLRACNVTTFLDELGEEGADFFTIKLKRKVNKRVIVRLMRAVFEWMPSETGSNDNCPYFGCLARAWHEYVRNYNNLARAIKDQSALKPVPQEWYIGVEEMTRYRNIIATMPYNTGPREGATAASEVNAQMLGANINQTFEPVAPFASQATAQTGMIDIFTALGVEQNKVEAGITNIDLSKYTPAQQAALRNGGIYDTTSVLDRRLVEIPEEKQLSIVERVGLSERRTSVLDAFNPSGSIFSESGGSLFDQLVSTGGKTGGTNTTFFK